MAALQWAAFGASMACVFCYGHSKLQGAIVGIVTALLFIIWGLSASVPAAAATNVFFLGLHSRNLKRALRERGSHADIRGA